MKWNEDEIKYHPRFNPKSTDMQTKTDSKKIPLSFLHVPNPT